MKETNKMKKLMIAAAIVCAAAISQASQFKWSTTDKFFGVAADDVIGNGSYDKSTANVDRGDKTGNLFAYVLTVYESGTKTVAGTASGSLGYALGKVNTTIEVDGLTAGTTYDFVMAVTGTQNSLSTKTSDTYDYSGATLSWSQNGSVEASSLGVQDLGLGVPATWAVSGIEKKEEPGPGPEPTPEPTSGLLMLLGMAGLALRRKRA